MVNKLSEIDNTYRNFQLEILAGVRDTMVQCKENGCEFKFDFATVYWNPRLSTEHERVVNQLQPNDVVYDCFAGVGPFSIPAISKRKCVAVMANDLNPNSFRYLLANYTFNNKSKLKKKEQEVKKGFVREHPAEPAILESLFKFSPSQEFAAFNLDARLFIQEKLKYHFIEIIRYLLKHKKETFATTQFYVLMNLPAMSVEFLDAFHDLYDNDETRLIKESLDEETRNSVCLNIYCYHFAKSNDSELERIQERIRTQIFKDESLKINSKHVRKVAPNKEMYCSMFKLKFGHLLTDVTQEKENLNGEDLNLNLKHSEDFQNDENLNIKKAKLI